MSTFGPSCRLGFALATSIASLACDSCRRDRPFTPFVVTAASTGSSTQVSRPPSTSKPDAYPTEGEKLPPNLRQFSLGVRQADAPESMTFDSVLRGDWNEDGKIDGIALLHAAPREARPIGAVYYYDGGGDARKLVDLPGWIPSGQDCTWESKLLRIGKHTATVDVRMHCSTPMPPRTSTRFVVVVSPTRSDPAVIAWRFAEPAPDETLDVKVAAADRDGDDRDDVTLTLTLGLVSKKEQVHGEFAWFDRAAGVSREPGHFVNSLGSVLTALEKKAASRNSAAEAISEASLVWRLLSSACAESATARVLASDGSALACENAGAIATRLTAIEVRAAMSQNDVLKAAFALTKAQGAFGAAASAPERGRIIKLIRKMSTSVDTLTATASDVRPIVPRSTPHYSPLQFQPDGTLLALTNHGVERVQLDGRESTSDADAAAPPSWPTAVESSDGRTWEGVVPACDRSEIIVVSKGARGNLLTPELTSLLAPRPGLCAGETSLHWRVSPLHFDEGKLPLALVEGACLSSDSTTNCLKPTQLGKAQPGAPLSPDGHWLVAMTGIGVFIFGGPKPEFWEGPVLGTPSALSECVVANGGENIACLRGSRLWLFAKSAPTATEKLQ